ncbi:Leucine-rich repeat-containing protein 59 [Liparis tanakae]|uniref:Leucine-rich repeat-containing protein 59 n=1 Tax=Liparis tanakae TaxID=230148 RepID=A0A4Z2GHN0_9TELE|nr:Leucine-rich repeat-containing protein 59 [Liparis tanakae]
MSKNSKVLNLKDKISGKEVDLSLCNLTEVPVRELALFTKATVVDLSCNNITSLPPEFCNLTHLVKVDLSQNQLTCLPDDLGNLASLQHLDLYNNKLTVLPVSVSQLKAGLAKAAGDCLDEKQCKQCAAKVLQHMSELQDEVDRVREKRRLREKELERKREVKQKEREAKDKEARKRDKAEEKEKRRKEYNAQMAATAAREQQKKKNEEKKKKNGQAAADKKAAVEKASKPQRSLLGLMFKLLLLLLLGLAGVAAACRLTDLQKEAVCVPVNVAVDDGLSWAKEQEVVVRQLVQNLSSAAKEFLESTQASKN